VYVLISSISISSSSPKTSAPAEISSKIFPTTSPPLVLLYARAIEPK